MNGTRYFPPLGLRAGCGRQKGGPGAIRVETQEKEKRIEIVVRFCKVVSKCRGAK